MNGDPLIERRNRWCPRLANAVFYCVLFAAGGATSLPAQTDATDDPGGESAESSSLDPARKLKRDAGQSSNRVGGDRRLGELELINGNLVVGSIDPTSIQGFLAWQSPEFLSPFDFRLESVRSVKFPIQEDVSVSQGDFAIELVNGDTIQGNVREWSPESVLIEASFGELRVRTSALSRIYRVENNPTLVFAGLDGLRALVSEQKSPWREEGNHLITDTPGAELNGNLHIPSRAVVEVQLAFSGMPNFVFAMGTKVDRPINDVTDGWRLETFGGKLSVVKEDDERADVAIVADLTLRRTIRLLMYLDQEAGTLQVFQPDGQKLAEIDLAPGNANAKNSEHRAGGNRTPRGGIRVINRGDDLRIERLRVARWSGDVPGQVSPGQATIAYSDGSFDSATVIGKPRDSEILRLQLPDGTTEIDWSRVIGIQPSQPKPPTQPAKCAIFLLDGVRISGTLQTIDQTHWVLGGDNLLLPIKIPRKEVRSFVVFEHDATEQTPSSGGRLGRLEIANRKLTGRLDPAGKQSPTGTGLHWHPFGSNNSSELTQTSSGRITYRDQPKVDSTSAAARALAMQRLRLQQQKRGLNFGQLFLRRADQNKAGEVKRDAHVVHVRSGDIINCRVESIDERGVHLSTMQSEGGFVPHENMKAIEFVANSPPPDLATAKRERLLTIPRLQKSAPPTHLLCSHNGDFLRCRLSSLDSETLRGKIQFEELELPRSRVAQIIWFHSDESEAEDLDPLIAPEPDEGAKPASVFDGRAQVLKRDGRRVTFRPQEVTERTIVGESEILGRCSFNIADIDQLIIGDQIAREVAELAYNKWRLQPAIEPLVTAAMEGEAPMSSGTESKLIGKPAPEVKLAQLDGSQFRLSDCKGQIVVLDFWATWCAPCMQTMPLVEAAIEGYDPERVRLVSINLEEPAEQIRSVLERHDMNVNVALDQDGVAAQRYEARAIPQLVIVGPDGVVERLFVGGGSGVVEQMKAAIDELLQ